MNLEQSTSANFEPSPPVLTMGAPLGVITYLETQYSAKNGTPQKWLHEALDKLIRT